MGMMDRAEIADALQRGGKPGSTPTAVIERGTTADAGGRPDHPGSVGRGDSRVTGRDRGGAGGRSRGPRPAAAAAAPVGGPLAGRTVVVTRSGPRAQGLLDALRRSRGHDDQRRPHRADRGRTTAGPPSAPRPHDVGRFGWVVFTSVNAVTRFMRELRDARAFGDDPGGGGRPGHGRGIAASGRRARSGAGESHRSWVGGRIPRPRPGRRRATRCCSRVRTSPRRPSPTGLAPRAGGCGASRPTAPWRCPHPTRRSWPSMARADAVVFTASSSAQAYAALRTLRRVAPAGPADGHLHRSDHGRVSASALA